MGAIIEQAYRAYEELDLMLVEVNPLAVLDDGTVIAADAKVTIDDNALYRHADLAELRDVSAADPQEQMARERGVTYVKLDGTIGILGNGAGLVMSTLDVVDQVGGTPANFLDVGGGARAEEIVAAMEIILSDAKVDAVLFNIFGGITRCDEVAQGILDALQQLEVNVPIVVRLDGTNDIEGRKLLQDAAPPGVHVERTMLEAAQRVVALARERRLMAVLVDSATRLVVQGITGREGTLPHAAQPRLRHEGRGRRDARQGRPGRRGHPGLRHRAPTPCARPEPTPRWCSCRRASPPTAILRGRRRRRRHHRLHHRGHPGPRHARRLHLPAAARDQAAGAELPRRALARRSPTSGSCRRRCSPAAASGSSRAPAR